MMLHIADENAAELRTRSRPAEVVTEAMLEKQEWEAFKAKVKRSRKLVSEAHLDEAGETRFDIDEDDVDLLLAIVGVLERAHEKRAALTLAEIVRELQSDRVLAREFAHAAREQTKRLLAKLREMNRAYQDSRGCYRLNRGP